MAMSNRTQSLSKMIATPFVVSHGTMTTEVENNTVSFKSNQVISSMVPVFIVIAVVAILGNLLVILLFVRNRSWLKKAHSNLILSMAITDILTAICILTVPLFVHDNDVYPVPTDSIARELYCRIVWSHYLVFSLGVTSVYTCLSLAIERWLAIGKPLFYKQHLHSKRNIAFMVFLPWLAGFAFEASALIRTTGVLHPDGTTNCRWNPDTSERPVRVAIAVVSFLGMILIPGMLVVATYAHILVKIKKALTSNSSQGERKSNSGSKTDFKRITVMAGVASIALITCWLPGQFYFMLGQMDYVQLDVIGHRWLNVLALSSTCLNPFIYAFWNPNYREGFKKELAWLVCRDHHSTTSHTVTSQSRDYSCVMVHTKTDERSPHISDVIQTRNDEQSPHISHVQTKTDERSPHISDV